MLWYWRCCTITNWYESIHEICEQNPRRELDRAVALPRWAKFKRKEIKQLLDEVRPDADFRLGYHMQRCCGKIVAVDFDMASANVKEFAEFAP